MAGISLRQLSPVAQAAWSDLRDRLQATLGDNLVAAWAHGGTASIGDPAHPGDLDTYVILARRPGAATAQQIEADHAALADEHGVEWDAWYVLADAAGRSAPPSHAWREGRRDTSWAIHRAHWLAGRYATLHGAEPAELVPEPTWDELRAELDRELEHIERHVLEGDTDPFEATYAILNGSRIARAVETGDVAISKAAAGNWALDHLPARWHPALSAALRAYLGEAGAEDEKLLAGQMAPFVAFVRERLPLSESRPEGTLPRWSGS
jgi:hypothetical protein